MAHYDRNGDQHRHFGQTIVAQAMLAQAMLAPVILVQAIFVQNELRNQVVHCPWPRHEKTTFEHCGCAETRRNMKLVYKSPGA